MDGQWIDPGMCAGLAIGQPIPENWPIVAPRISGTVQLGHEILQSRPNFGQMLGNRSIWPIRVGQGQKYCRAGSFVK